MPDKVSTNANLREISLMPSTIETIDKALFEWIDEELNIFATTNKGWNKVPVVWAGSERAHQIKSDKDLRDSSGVLKFPMITLSRESIAKDSNFKGVAWAHLPPTADSKGGAITVARTIGQVKTADFKNSYSYRQYKDYNFPSKENLTVYNTMTMPMPTYITLLYDIKIRAEYQQQINEILTPFITYTGQIDNFFIKQDGHRFEGFIQGSFGQGNNITSMSDEERKYETAIQAKILGYLLGSGPNEERPKIAIRENLVTLVQVSEVE